MTTLNVRLHMCRDNSYRILIEPGCFKNIPSDLKHLNITGKICILTDTHVKKIYGEELLLNLREIGFDATLLSFQAGEHQKRLATVEKLANQMVQLGHNRHSTLLALGGGVVGDLGGFLASIFMRGIPYFNIPTTLLAMADSSLGGKTGVDLASGKNLIGTFVQPQKVYMDPQLLSTLSLKQRQSGLAEIVKHGLIADKKILKLLRKFPQKALDSHAVFMTKLLTRSCDVKKFIIEKDERENQKRMWLNYGHSIGHALEHASAYRLTHGQAISIGMNLENRLAVRRKLMKPKRQMEIEALLKSLGLPTEIPAKIDRKPILNALAMDKKNRGRGFTMTLLKKPKKPIIVEGITEEEVLAIL